MADDLGCPKCGNAPDAILHECSVCEFHGEGSLRFAWARAVTRELSDQMLALRTHGFQTMHNEPGSPSVHHDIATARSRVISDYLWLCAHPLNMENTDA